MLHAKAVEEGIRARLGNLNKGPILLWMLIILPIMATTVSVVGGLYTVYASTDCQHTKFKQNSRMFLYTSIAFTLTNIIMDRTLGALLLSFTQHRLLAFWAYRLHALVLAGFLLTMVVLLVMVYRTACSSVRDKVKSRVL